MSRGTPSRAADAARGRRLEVVGPAGAAVCETAGQVAERLARQVDALTGEVEALAEHNRTVLELLASRLGQVHVDLDELANRSSAGADR